MRNDDNSIEPKDKAKSYMKYKKPLIVSFIIIALVISGLALYTRVRMRMESSILGPVGIGSQAIMKKRYEEGKVIRIYFKNDMTDDQALSLMNEWKQLPNVNGSSFTSAKLAGKTIVDLFVVEVGKKQDVIQVVEQNAFVEKVTNGKE